MKSVTATFWLGILFFPGNLLAETAPHLSATRGGFYVGGLDVKSDQAHDWTLNSSVKAGLQFDSTESNGRYLRLPAVGYVGFVPYGQFCNNRVTYAGFEASYKF